MLIYLKWFNHFSYSVGSLCIFLCSQYLKKTFKTIHKIQETWKDEVNRSKYKKLCRRTNTSTGKTFNCRLHLELWTGAGRGKCTFWRVSTPRMTLYLLEMNHKFIFKLYCNQSWYQNLSVIIFTESIWEKTKLLLKKKGCHDTNNICLQLCVFSNPSQSWSKHNDKSHQLLVMIIVILYCM